MEIPILYLFALPCLLLQVSLITGSLSTVPEAGNGTPIGAILDQTSRPGKEAKVAIELAIQDFNIKTSKTWVLYLQNSRNKPLQAAIAAKELIDEHKVKAILGAHTWEEASTIAEVISDNEPDHHIPVFLSLASSIPQQATDQWPFLIQAVHTQSMQMNAIAALLQTLDIHKVTLIYEISSSASLMPHLSYALQQTGGELTHILPLASGSYSLYQELEVLKSQKHKVFVVHTSLELGVHLFETAKKMEMTGDGYVWIATNGITDLFHSINSTMISSLKGMVGVKSYFRENTPEFLNFKKRFHQKFNSDYSEEDHDEPGIFAVQGYNAMKLLAKNSPENFNEWKPILGNTVEIVNVIGKRYNSVYWTEGLGFSDTVEDDINGATTYTHSLDDVAQPWYASRRRIIREKDSRKRIRVAAPCQSLFPEFVKCDYEKRENNITGFVVDVFDAMMTKMNQPYDLFQFNGSYDELMEDLKSEKFDAVAGDLTITEKRLEYASFTQPYTESGLEMIVLIRSGLSNQSWLFLKPFTAEMWWLIVVITTYNGFVIWLIERNHDKNLQGSMITQIGIILWLAFSSLFALRGDKMHSNLSRMAVVTWLFVALIIIQSYTASLASMLTVQRQEPTIKSAEILRKMNATVGSCHGSFVDDYLRVVLDFEVNKTMQYSSTHGYAEALNSRKIAAIFLEVPSAKVFLAQYCKSFIRTGETFKVGGFGFAFVKGFPRLTEANKALMNVSESRELKQLEDKYLNSGKCVDEESSPEENLSLNFHSFRMLFMITGGTSTLALSIYIIMGIYEYIKLKQGRVNLFQLIAYIKIWQLRRRMRRSSSTVANVEL